MLLEVFFIKLLSFNDITFDDLLTEELEQEFKWSLNFAFVRDPKSIVVILAFGSTEVTAVDSRLGLDMAILLELEPF